jgi:hypothetical protein
MRERKESLEEELASVREETCRLEELCAREADLVGEIDALEVQIAGRAKRRLPTLDDVRVAAACNVSWDAMVGDDRVRHCNQCGKNVYQLSAMTRAEAEALVQDRMDDMPCVRFYRRADGTMLTQDCPVGVGRRRRRRLVIAGVVTAAAVLVVNEIGNSSNCSLASDPLRGEIHQGIGAVSDPGSQAVYK